MCCNKAFKCILWDRSTKACLVPFCYLVFAVNFVQLSEMNGVLALKCSYTGESIWRSQFGAFVTVAVTCTDSKTQNTAWQVTGHSCNVWVRIKCELESILCWVCTCSSVCSRVFVSYSAIGSCSSTAQPALNSKGLWPPSSEGKLAARLGHTCPYCCRVSPGLEMC